MQKRHSQGRLVLPWFGVACLLFCLSGCGGGDSGDSATSTVDDSSLDVDVDLGDLEVDLAMRPMTRQRLVPSPPRAIARVWARAGGTSPCVSFTTVTHPLSKK